MGVEGAWINPNELVWTGLDKLYGAHITFEGRAPTNAEHFADEKTGGSDTIRVHRTADIRYIPLPRRLWTPFLSAGLKNHCRCRYCKGKPGFLDTLACTREAPTDAEPDLAFILHAPKFRE